MITLKLAVTGETEDAVETTMINTLGALRTEGWKIVSVGRSRKKFPTYWLKVAKVVRDTVGGSHGAKTSDS